MENQQVVITPKSAADDGKTSTYDLAKSLELPHRTVKLTASKYLSDIATMGNIVINRRMLPTGRPIEEYLFNEKQTSYLVLLLPATTESTIIAKYNFVKRMFETRDKWVQLLADNPELL